MPHTYSLMIHGGSGSRFSKAEWEMQKKSMRAVLERGEQALSSGTLALDVVEQCVATLEDDPLFNAGRGSVLSEDGRVACDAAIMDGSSLSCGAVASVRNIKNPIKLARRIMEESPYVFLIGEGAARFAESQGIERRPDRYFATQKRVRQWRKIHDKQKTSLGHNAEDTEAHYGTVGAVARDQKGNLAAATSTGGVVNKKNGRVGDSPLIGAGTFADNAACAISATGSGEGFIKTVLAKTTADFIVYQKLTAQAAADAGITYLVQRVGGRGGMIVIDARGRFGAAHSTPYMLHGFVQNGKPLVIAFGKGRE